jgi:hypothetical protein
MREIEVNKQLPVITMNFEEVKISLQETIEKYKGIVVTEEGLKDCKATQKELAGVRNKIDTYRKDVKKEMEKPIKDFEGQCKELISLISDAEKPIKEGIEVFDNKKREEKKLVAEEEIFKAIKFHNLEPKYANQLTVLDKYLNLSGSKKSVFEDIAQRASTLEYEQKSEKTMIENMKISIKSEIDRENQATPIPLKIEDYEKYIGEWSLDRILQAIQSQANRLRQAEKAAREKAERERLEKERKAAEQPKEEPKKEPINIPLDLNSHEPVKKEPAKEDFKYFVEMKVVGSFEEIQSLSRYLKDNGYNYKAIKKGRVEDDK